jgi:hypothetical protein
MDFSKDYYGILGILPTAEDIVIRAAYKALVQRYHPDRADNQVQANETIKELNEAYAVLSDPKKRKEYDDLVGDQFQADQSTFAEDISNTAPEDDPLFRDWLIAINYYSNLNEQAIRLDKISFRLGYSYRATLLQTRKFQDGVKIAEQMEQEFLKIYFGENKDIISTAKTLALLENRPALRELNETMKVLGSKLDEQVVADVIYKIIIKYEIKADLRLSARISYLMANQAKRHKSGAPPKSRADTGLGW